MLNIVSVISGAVISGAEYPLHFYPGASMLSTLPQMKFIFTITNDDYDIVSRFRIYVYSLLIKLYWQQIRYSWAGIQLINFH